jgi:hypothetical protein
MRFGLEAIDGGDGFIVDMDADMVAGGEANLLELAHDALVVADGPEDVPDGVADRVDAVGVVAAEVDAQLVLGDQGVRLGDEGVHPVEVVVQRLGERGLHFGLVVQVMGGDLKEFLGRLDGEAQDGETLVAQGKGLLAFLVGGDVGQDRLKSLLTPLVDSQQVLALTDHLQQKGPGVHHVDHAFPVVAAHAHAPDAGEPDGAFAVLFVQDVDVGDILGLHHEDLALF